MKTIKIFAFIILSLFISNISLLYALTFPMTSYNVIADGQIVSGEWSDADSEADSNGSDAGAMYAMWKGGYQVGTGSYDGDFQFLLHDIEQLQSKEDADYNVFDFYASSSSIDPILTAWVFNNDDSLDDSWLNPAGLGGDFAQLDDRGFLVYNYAEDDYRHWLPGDGAPEDGGYDWDNYWGVYARGGFNNSAFDEGLTFAKNSSNEIYEVIYRLEAGSSVIGSSVRRSIKDPDDLPTDTLIDYWDGEIIITPEASTMTLLGIALIGFAGITRRRLYNR